MKKARTKCYIYTRVSTAMQVDGYSLDAQREKLRKYADYEDMVIAGEYSDEGFSGKNIQGRHEFQQMLRDVQDCKDGVSYVLVFKLSRFGRNAADVLNSLQLMQDFGVNLICVEDGIDSSKDSGKLMISVLSAVAEIERVNIRAQTMAGREQKAREGKWNGGFAPYGYRLENGELSIADDEVEVIRVIFDRFIHTNDGVAGIARYLNTHGYVKKLRQNGTIPKFSAVFVRGILETGVSKIFSIVFIGFLLPQRCSPGYPVLSFSLSSAALPRYAALRHGRHTFCQWTGHKRTTAQSDCPALQSQP